MADICINCPVTGQTVATGMKMEPEEFQSSDPGMNTFLCPACEETHTWNKRDAFLRDSEAGMD